MDQTANPTSSPEWEFTGTWGASSAPYSGGAVPDNYTITGSHNSGKGGELNIACGTDRGFIAISFSGGSVVAVQLTAAASGEPLPGVWSAEAQVWTPSDREATVQQTFRVSITVAEGNTADVHAHFPDVWDFTGSWGRPSAPYCTPAWGPSVVSRDTGAAVLACEAEEPPSYTITGSTNGGATAELSVESGTVEPWTKVAFSGARLKGVYVLSPSGLALAGQWSPEAQAWTPNSPGETERSTWTVHITVDEASLEDVNAHFSDAWDLTGSWGPPAAPSCASATSGPGGCTVEDPPSFNVTGSVNPESEGSLTIGAGRELGWTQVAFSGAPVLAVAVCGCDGCDCGQDGPDGTFRQSEQT